MKEKIKTIFKKLFSFLKKFIKLIGILIGSYIIISIPFSLIFFLLFFVGILSPSFSINTLSIFGLILLTFVGLFTVFYYLNLKFRRIFKILLIVSLPTLLIFNVILRNFLFQPVTFKGNELEPYLKDGQYIIVQKIDKTIKRGSIVAFRSPEGRVSLSIVFALSGEKVAVKNGVLYVNDQLFKEIQYNWDNCFIDSEIKIPEDYFLYVSTNMDCSTPHFDISQWIAHKSQIIGKLLFKAKID